MALLWLFAGGVCAATTLAKPERAQRESPDSMSTKTRFAYKADGKRLADVLRDFAAAQGVPVVVEPKIEGLVSGNFDTTPSEFLEAMTRAYSLIWYFDGTALYVYAASSIQSRIFRLKGYSEDQVAQMLATLKLKSTRYPIRFDRANSTLLVYGPPRHVELVSLAIESLDVGALEDNRRIVRVFRLKHASAGDRVLGSMRISGVVTTLSALYGGQPQRPADMLGNAQRQAQRQMAPLNRALQQPDPEGRNRMLPDMKMPQGGGLPNGSSTARTLKSPLEEDADNDSPTFEVDEPSNSIIVYCRTTRMKEIAQLIRTLDVPSTLVELEATFIEVSTDDVNELGVDWALSSKAVSVGSRGGDIASVDRAGAGLLPIPTTLTTLLRDAGRALMANVRAMEGKGKARIVSKPRVLGLANRPAVMAEKRVANVRVAGNLEANLFQVEAGTTLQVTPQVTPGENGRPATIKLSIYIEDGNFEGSVVDKVPVLKRTEIKTEARVLEGESLLVGGISIESESGIDSGVPKLKSFPFVGGLFRNVSQRSMRLERLFLLTPRVIQSLPQGELVGAAVPRASDGEMLASAALETEGDFASIPRPQRQATSVAAATEDLRPAPTAPTLASTHRGTPDRRSFGADLSLLSARERSTLSGRQAADDRRRKKRNDKSTQHKPDIRNP